MLLVGPRAQAYRAMFPAPNVLLLQVGIGAFVVNSKKEVLVVQERFGPLKGTVSVFPPCKPYAASQRAG